MVALVIFRVRGERNWWRRRSSQSSKRSSARGVAFGAEASANQVYGPMTSLHQYSLIFYSFFQQLTKKRKKKPLTSPSSLKQCLRKRSSAQSDQIMSGRARRRRLSTQSGEEDSDEPSQPIELKPDEWNGFCEIESEPVSYLGREKGT